MRDALRAPAVSRLVPESIMIAALFALAAAMIIGGCAAVIQGFPYVRLESGLAMAVSYTHLTLPTKA